MSASAIAKKICRWGVGGVDAAIPDLGLLLYVDDILACSQSVCRLGMLPLAVAAMRLGHSPWKFAGDGSTPVTERKASRSRLDA